VLGVYEKRSASIKERGGSGTLRGNRKDKKEKFSIEKKAKKKRRGLRNGRITTNISMMWLRLYEAEKDFGQ